MKPWMHLALAVIVAALVGAGLAFTNRSARDARAAHDSDAEVAALRSTVVEITQSQQRLAERLAALPATTGGAPSATRAPIQDLDQAIADYMARQLSEPAQDDSGGRRKGNEPADLESAAIADRILGGEVTGDELEALWAKLRKEDRVDAVVAEIERQAELAPNTPDLQSQLGEAYLQKLFTVGIGPMAGMWGEKADKAFDHALELDENHWEARFHKALALSNWPEFLGKQSESIQQFEILVERQERSAPEERHALTYFFLGNMYEKAGEADKAKAMWKRGLQRFPRDESLLKKMEGR